MVLFIMTIPCPFCGKELEERPCKIRNPTQLWVCDPCNAVVTKTSRRTLAIGTTEVSDESLRQGEI